MKVLDLQCVDKHSFEGWFGSEEDFQAQLTGGLVECPMCGSVNIAKQLSAPRLNLGAAKPADEQTATPVVEAHVPPQPMPSNVQAAWLKMVHHVLANTEDVGKQFAEEARKIHYGESQERAIRGQASAEETEALLDEGISVMPLPIPAALKGPLQ